MCFGSQSRLGDRSYNWVVGGQDWETLGVSGRGEGEAQNQRYECLLAFPARLEHRIYLGDETVTSPTYFGDLANPTRQDRS